MAELRAGRRSPLSAPEFLCWRIWVQHQADSAADLPEGQTPFLW